MSIWDEEVYNGIPNMIPFAATMTTVYLIENGYIQHSEFLCVWEQLVAERMEEMGEW